MGKKKGIVTSSKEEHRNIVRAQLQKDAINEKTGYGKAQARVYTFLERPSTKFAFSYHCVNLSMILGSIITSVLSTIDDFEKSQVFADFILYYEVCLLVWFTIEYILRVWSCGVVGKYKGFIGRLMFMKSFYMFVDFFVIGTTLTTILLQTRHSYFTMLRITRFLQVFRVLRVDRQRGDLKTMGNVVYKHKKELVTCYFVGFIILFGGTYIVYIIEKGSGQPTIDNMANGLYWAMITVTSVGYGDISPATGAGKICTGFFALVGCAFFALPAGILGSGFALQVAKQKKEKRYTKIKNPAAVVIQTLWRNHAVRRKQERLQGTWNYLFPQIIGSAARPGYHALLPGIHAIHDSNSFEHFRTRVGRKKTTGSMTHPDINEKKSKRFGKKAPHISHTQRSSSFNMPSNSDEDHENIELLHPSIRTKLFKGRQKTVKRDKKPISLWISERYKAAIRFTLRVKYFTCIQHFKSQRYPFVNVQDIMEKNSHDHLETLSYLNSIKKCIDDFRGDLYAMKAVLRDYDLVPKHTILLHQQLLAQKKNKEENENSKGDDVFFNPYGQQDFIIDDENDDVGDDIQFQTLDLDVLLVTHNESSSDEQFSPDEQSEDQSTLENQSTLEDQV